MWQYSLIAMSYPKAMAGCFPNKSIAIFILKIKHAYFLFVNSSSLQLLKLINMQKVDVATYFRKTPPK